MRGCSPTSSGTFSSGCGRLSSSGGGGGGAEIDIFLGAGSGAGFANRPAQPVTLPVGMTLLFISSGLTEGSLEASPLINWSAAAASPFVGASAHEPLASVVEVAAVSAQPSGAALTVFSEALVPFVWLVALPPLAPRPRSVPRPRVRPSKPPRPRVPRVPAESFEVPCASFTLERDLSDFLATSPH